MTEMVTQKHRLADVRTAVYRFFDASDDLLYIGITHAIGKRWTTHSRIQPWWLDVARREFTWYGTRAEAEQVEATDTALEEPRYDRNGKRAEGGEVDDRLKLETARAMDAVSADIENGTYPLWSLLPSYGALSERYAIPVVGLTRGLAKLMRRDHVLAYQHDQFAVSRPDCVPSEDAQRVGLLFFLASNAFRDLSFTLTDLTETTGYSRGTAHQHVKRWEEAGRAERIGKVPGKRTLLYRITQHPEPDPPQVLMFWRRNDVAALADWLTQQMDADLNSASGDLAAVSLVGRDREIINACLPDEYGVSDAGVRVLKVMARRYADRPGCLSEWGIPEGAAS